MSYAKGQFLFYHYDPSLVAAIIFIVLFALTTFLHILQLAKNRTWYFIPFMIGGIFETIGYVGRVVSAKQTPNWTLIPYIIQTLLTLLAPALFAASIYMILGRIIRLTDGEQHTVIKAKWITKIFVAGDVVSFLAQSAGGGILAKAKDNSDFSLGEHIITGGLGIQILFFGFFIIVGAIFHYRILRYPSSRAASLQVPWQRYLYVLYIASAAILIRSVFRMVSYIMGEDSVLLGNEIYLYLFDTSLMFLTMVLFNVMHPSKIISVDEDSSHISSQAIEEYGLESNTQYVQVKK